MSKTFKEELSLIIRKMGNSFVAIEGYDYEAEHEALTAILALIKKHQPEKQEKSNYMPPSWNKDKLLLPEYTNERIWGYNQALADSDKAYGLEDVE